MAPAIAKMTADLVTPKHDVHDNLLFRGLLVKPRREGGLLAWR